MEHPLAQLEKGTSHPLALATGQVALEDTIESGHRYLRPFRQRDVLSVAERPGSCLLYDRDRLDPTRDQLTSTSGSG